jgi:hypothetical protein
VLDTIAELKNQVNGTCRNGKNCKIILSKITEICRDLGGTDGPKVLLQKGIVIT